MEWRSDASSQAGGTSRLIDPSNGRHELCLRPEHGADPTRFEGAANVLIFASTDAASAVRNVLKAKARGLEVGPILMGMGNRAHIVTPSITARGLLNMSAIAGTPVAHYG